MGIVEVHSAIERSDVRVCHTRNRAPGETSSASEGAVGRLQLDTHASTRAVNDNAKAGWYRRSVDIAFAVFSSTRLLTYVPTMLMIYTSADSSQYSLVTWLAWIGSNASMALWLFENNERRLDKAVIVSIGNALMCLATCTLITAYRV